MAKTKLLEADIELPVVAKAEEEGWFVRKVEWVNRRNAPDRVFAKKVGVGRREFWVEFKRPGEKPRPGQEREIARMRAAGMEVHVIDNLKDGYALLS